MPCFFYVKHIGMWYWSPLVVQLLYAGSVSYPCWPLSEWMLADVTVHVYWSISQRQCRHPFPSAGRTGRHWSVKSHSERADNGCRQWGMLLYGYIIVITQNKATSLTYLLLLIWHIVYSLLRLLSKTHYTVNFSMGDLSIKTQAGIAGASQDQ